VESRPGIGPGYAVLQTTFLARDPAHFMIFCAGADSGNRTRIDGLEARGPALGRCPRSRTALGRSAGWEVPAAWAGGAVKENRTPVASLARSHSTIELPPHESSTGADSGSRTRIERLGTSHLDRWTMSALLPRAARENCTRRLLLTKQAPRCLGLSSMICGVDRDRTGYLLTASQALSRIELRPQD
jgi:hypothetical protein